MCCSDVRITYTWIVLQDHRRSYCLCLQGEVTSCWPLPLRFCSSNWSGSTKAIRGKHQFMWPFCPLPFFYSCFPGSTFHAGITLLQTSYSISCPPPSHTPKSNMRSPVWCLYFCPTLHWLHESIRIFPIDLWSCTLGTVPAGDFVGLPWVKMDDNLSEMSEVQLKSDWFQNPQIRLAYQSL